MTIASLEKFTKEFECKIAISSQQRFFLQAIFSAGFTYQLSPQKQTASFYKNDIKYGFINSEIKNPKIIGYTFQAKHHPDSSITGDGKNASPLPSSTQTKEWLKKQYNCIENTDYLFRYNPKTNEHYVYIIDLQMALKVFGINESLHNNSIISSEETTEEFLPDWPYVKTVINLMEDEAPTYNEILDKVEEKARDEHKVLKKNWREITRKNIPLWLAAQSE